MTPETVVEIGQQALFVAVLLAAPMLLAALATGLAVGLFQAATQINEQTLSFIPKLFVMVVVMAMSAPWLLDTIITFTRALILDLVPRVAAG